MTLSEQLANRFEEVLFDGLWIANTNYKAQLEDITFNQAITKIGPLNTIAEITFHINYYIAGLIPVFNGGPLKISDRFSFYMSPITSKEEWDKLLESLLTNSKILFNQIKQFPENKLNDIFVEEKYGSFLRNIEGMIEHCYYHLGQISLIKKMILQK